MSVENVELARRAILGWDQRGIDAIVEILDPAVEWHPPRESMEPGTYRGHDGVRDYFGRLREIFEDVRVELIDVMAVDKDVVLAVARVVGQSARFGPIDTEWAWLITMRNGKATHVATFIDRHEARRVARLPE
jgi:ketosteroid isomerase-like protein